MEIADATELIRTKSIRVLALASLGGVVETVNPEHPESTQRVALHNFKLLVSLISKQAILTHRTYQISFLFV
jgi:hypothetical protein